jgi:CheY-like chemotaxis protein
MDSTISGSTAIAGSTAWDASEMVDASEFVRVTVVDDDDEFVALMEDLLGHRFRVTGILPRTITELSATDPELVFVDVFVRNDDVLGGWDLIDLARRDPRLRGVPIILCTGEIGPDLDRLTQLPDVHFLAKPFDLDVLESTMRRAMAASA